MYYVIGHRIQIFSKNKPGSKLAKVLNQFGATGSTVPTGIPGSSVYTPAGFGGLNGYTNNGYGNNAYTNNGFGLNDMFNGMLGMPNNFGGSASGGTANRGLFPGTFGMIRQRGRKRIAV